MSTTDSAFYETLIVGLVAPMLERPDDLDITISRRGNGIGLSYTCNPSETGRLIGNRGETVRAVRSLVDFVAGRRGDRVVVDVRDA